MKIRQRVTLIILRDEKLLLIRRTRDGRTFTVLPGGGVEDGETLAAAAMREALEETSLAVSLGPILWTRPITTSVSNGDTFEQVETA
ncbi:MAG: NUDIX domain-containing protein, partial [Chloroflexi bacterium]|nr:NUDIX domain-containing protein [Chloroflexota bacterium]